MEKIDRPVDDLAFASRPAKRLLSLDWITQSPDKELHGLNQFPGHKEVYWTDASFDAATSEGRQQIAERLGVKLEDIIAFSAKQHTNEIVIVDSKHGVKKIDIAKVPDSNEFIKAGWSEPIEPSEDEPEKGAERGTYDGLILIGRENFEGKYLLVTGADCTSVGVRGSLVSEEEFIAIAHGGREGTLDGIMENLASRLHWIGVDISTIEIFIGPAAQAIELELYLLESKEKKEAEQQEQQEEEKKRGEREDKSWRAGSISEVYEVEKEVGQESKQQEQQEVAKKEKKVITTLKTLYDNQFDTTRRLVERLGVNGNQVHIIDVDTVSEEYRGKLHSYRRDKTPARNSLILGFSKKDS